MKKVVLGFIVALVAFFTTATVIKQLTIRPDVHVVTASRYVGIPVTTNSAFKPNVRLLVLKHCPDNVADTDARQALQAADMGKSAGLTIKQIGNYHINKQGKTDSMVWGKKVYLDDLAGLKAFIIEQMKVSAVKGDTFVLYTLGHGSGSGSVMRLGHRKNIVRAIAEAAEECSQETLWWQLSCHAGAGLPDISELNEKQQELFSMIASSDARTLSYFNTQGAQMQKVFVALGENSVEINPDQDDIVTAGELAKFLDNTIKPGRGDLLFARSKDEPIFGWWDWANRIPINDPWRQEFPRDYIPHPQDLNRRLP